MKIELLPCQQRHFDAIQNLVNATDEIADYEGEAYAFFSPMRMEKMAASPDALFLVAELEGVFAGFFLLLLHRAAGMGYVTDMAVVAEFQRTGIGGQFVQAGLDFAKKAGCDEVWCIVHEQNEAAWRMFEQAGFRRGRRFFYVGKTLD